jgi:hypothetical protein
MAAGRARRAANAGGDLASRRVLSRWCRVQAVALRTTSRAGQNVARDLDECPSKIAGKTYPVRHRRNKSRGSLGETRSRLKAGSTAHQPLAGTSRPGEATTR